MTDETLKRFVESIESRSGEEIAELRNHAQTVKKAQMEQLGYEAQQKADRYLESSMSSVRSAGRRRLAARQTENNRQLLDFRRKCAEEMTGVVREKIRTYAADAGYKDVLCKLTEQAFRALGEPEEMVVYLRREDKMFEANLGEAFAGRNIRFSEGKFVLGGVIAEAPAVGRRVDMSFDTGLLNAQEHFAELSGMELS